MTDSESESADGDFKESKLGTREYWDAIYHREQGVFEDSQDCGEIWFGKRCLQRVLAACDELFPGDLRSTAKVLDIGTGNGVTLIKLKKKHGFCGTLVGTDYSAPAVTFARQVATTQGVLGIEFVEDDYLASGLLPAHAQSFDLILDKGTFDAISLRSDSAEARQQYVVTTTKLLKPGTGRFVLTSCNWTEEELLTQFLPAGFQFVQRIAYPTFSFGGGTGSTTSTVILSYPNSE